MWYFAWILGLGLAVTFGILNAIWFEIRDIEQDGMTGQGRAPTGSDLHAVYHDDNMA